MCSQPKGIGSADIFALTYDKGRTIPLVPLTLHRK